ncbi:MAG: hypothetical protein ACRDT6_09115 [Micromonosporaceae bacterium]
MAVEEADEEFRGWMRGNLTLAAQRFGVHVVGEPSFGWCLRSISAPVDSPDGHRWLRLVSEMPEWAHGDPWTGNADANVIRGVVKPVVLDVTEWAEKGWRHQRAELMTRMPGTPCSVSDVARGPIDLPDTWWAELRRSIDTVRAVPTQRINIDEGRVADRLRAAYGDGADHRIAEWETAHGDLHWNNLLQPGFGLLDWELWGRGPAGTDAATLLLYSLLVPDLAVRVHGTFADQLDTDAGRQAQLIAAARLHSRIGGGDYPELAEPLGVHVERLGARFLG